MLDSFGIGADVVSCDTRAPGAGGEHAREDSHRGRLARAVGSDDAENFARLHRKAQMIDRADSREIFEEAADGDGVVSHGYSRTAPAGRAESWRLRAYPASVRGWDW